METVREYNDVKPEDISNSEVVSNAVRNAGDVVKRYLKASYFAPTMLRKHDELDREDWPEDINFMVPLIIGGISPYITADIAQPFMESGHETLGLAIFMANAWTTNLVSLAYEAVRYPFASAKKKLIAEEKERKTEILEQSTLYEGLVEEDFNKRLEN